MPTSFGSKAGIAQGDIRALGPYLKIIAAHDRLHGLDRRLPLPRAGQTRNARTAAASHPHPRGRARPPAAPVESCTIWRPRR